MHIDLFNEFFSDEFMRRLIVLSVLERQAIERRLDIVQICTGLQPFTYTALVVLTVASP